MSKIKKQNENAKSEEHTKKKMQRIQGTHKEKNTKNLRHTQKTVPRFFATPKLKEPIYSINLISKEFSTKVVDNQNQKMLFKNNYHYDSVSDGQKNSPNLISK